MPLSWRHFNYGLDYIRRHKSRRALLMSDAYRMSKTEPNDYRAWRSIHENVARY